MTSFVFANNVDTRISAAILASDVSILLDSAANLPALASGQQMPLTLNSGVFYEIVYVTAIAGPNLTVIRGQEGTTAIAWPVGSYAFSTQTAAANNQAAFAYNQIGSFSGTNDFLVSGTIPDSTYGQSLHVVDGVTLTLPVTPSSYGILYFYGTGYGDYYIQAGANQFIYSPTMGFTSTAGGTFMTVKGGQSLVLLSRGSGEFDVIGGTAQLQQAVSPTFYNQLYSTQGLTSGGNAFYGGNLGGTVIPGDGTTNGYASFGWNYSNAHGETDFINAKGPGNPGGFSWYSYDGTTATKAMNLSGAGVLTLGASGKTATTTLDTTPGQPAVAITVGASPFAYTATYGGSVAVSGGSLSQVALSRGGVTVFTSALAADDLSVRAGDVVTVTYTAAPTMYQLSD